MDPYFSIKQVDINRHPLSIGDENVESFNHVVCYDSEFRDENVGVACSTLDYESNVRSNKLITKDENVQDFSQKNIFSSPSKTFKAFTETVEALALQQSVIGNSNIKPASKDEIAKVVEEAREKLRGETKLFDQINFIEQNLENSICESRVVDTKILERSPKDVTLNEDHVDDVMVVEDRVDDVMVIMMEEQAKKLIRIPQECLKTERQVKSKMVWNIPTKDRTTIINHNNDSELRRNILLKSFTSNHENARDHHMETDFQRDVQHSNQQNTHSHDPGSIVCLKIIENIKNGNTKNDFAVQGNYNQLLIDKKYEGLLIEQAQMEGRIDILQVENKKLLEIRSELERRLGDLSTRIQNMEQTSEKTSQQGDDPSIIIKNLQGQRSRLEAVILDARRLISEKDDDLTALSDELDGSRKLAAKLENQVLQERAEVQNLNAMIKVLQSKVTELYVDLQTTNQNRIVSENEVQSLRGELKAALAAKEWYKEQLTLCQHDKSQLQNEMTSTKSEMIKQSTAMEKLKAENTRIKVSLNETEQKLLSEKLSMARHLENIEAEMMEREALIMQSNKEYLTLKISCKELNDEKSKEKDTECLSISEGGLIHLKNELEKYQSLHEQAVKSLDECRSNFSSLEDSFSEKQKFFESREMEKSFLMEEIGQLKLKLMEQFNRMDVVEQEKAILQMDLTSTKEEKKVINESLTALKQNLKSVDQNFHSIKNELIHKNEELASIKKLLQERLEMKSDDNLREINSLNFFTSNPLEDNSCQNVSTQTMDKFTDDCDHPGEDLTRIKVEKKEVENKLVIVSDQLKNAQERHKHQLRVECELEIARKEVEELREKMKTRSNSDSFHRNSRDLGSLSDCCDENKLDQGNVKVTSEGVNFLKVRCKVQGGCPPIKKAHLEGIDSRNARLADNVIVDADVIDGSGCRENVDTTVVTNNDFLCKAEGNSICLRTSDGSSLNASEGECIKNLELERRLFELQQKFLKAEQRATSVEEQRNKVIFLEDQLDQTNQAREIEQIRHKEEVERMGGDLISLEAEVQRLREEILLVRHDTQNSTYRDYARDFKSAIFDKSKKKFYGARLFEQEELDQTLPSPHGNGCHHHHSPSISINSPLNEDKTLSSEPFHNNIAHDDPPCNNTTQGDPKHVPVIATSYQHNLHLQSEMDCLMLQSLIQEKEYLANHCDQLTIKVDQLSKENSALRNSLVELEDATKMEVERHKQVVMAFELRLHELTISVQHERNIIIHNFSLELEKERGKVLELINSQNFLEEHATKLKKSLAARESSDLRMTSMTREQMQDRESEIAELNERLRSLEENLNAEQIQLKEAKKAVLIERGNNIRLKLDLEEASIHNKQLLQEIASLGERTSTLNAKVDTLEQNNSKMTLEIKKLTSEVKVQMSEEEKLRRELDDFRVRDATLNDQIKTLEWKLSQRIFELAASDERTVLMMERQMCQVNSLTESLKVKASDLQTLQSEMITLTRERAELRARIIQFKKAIIDILKQHSHASEKGRMSVDELVLNKEEMERLLIDALPLSADNKPLSFLQATLSSLRGEINSLHNQVNAHATAAQSSSMAWRELEAQVQDLREICRTSAASRAHSDRIMHDTDQLIVSTLQLPTGFNSLLPPSSSLVVMDTSTTHVSQVHTTNSIHLLD